MWRIVAGLGLLVGCGSSAHVHPRINAQTPLQSIALAINPKVSPSELVDTQIDIVRAAFTYAPVTIYAATDEDRIGIEERLTADEQLSSAMLDGRIRVIVAHFEGPWIRDYGPLLGNLGFVDAGYDDTSRRGDLEQLKTRLYQQVWVQLQAGTPDDSAKFTRLIQSADAVDKYSHSRIRAIDDEAPLSLLTSAYPPEDVKLAKIDLEIDGGNLLRLASGVCITTTDTLEKNRAVREDISSRLQKAGLCRDVVFLRPLPGSEIIKHVDMFLLPADGRDAVFLADFSEASRRAEDQSKDTNTGKRDTLLSLDVDAMLAMNENADLLKRRGIEVTRVPALGAVYDVSNGIYFPTTLNGIYVGRRENRLLIVPKYQDQDREIQDASLRILSADMPRVKIIEVESTTAATEQGAVHCLTTELPALVDRFQPSQGERVRRFSKTYERKRLRADEMFKAAIGTWRASNSGAVVEITPHELVIFDIHLKLQRDGDVLVRTPISISLIGATAELLILNIDGELLTLLTPDGYVRYRAQEEEDYFNSVESERPRDEAD